MALRNSWPLLMIYMARLLDYKHLQISPHQANSAKMKLLLIWKCCNTQIPPQQEATISVTVKSITAAVCEHKDSDKNDG